MSILLAYLAGILTLPAIALACIVIYRPSEKDAATSLIPHKRW